MKRIYQIREWKAVEKFRSHLASDPGAIQMVLPLAEIAQLLRQGVSRLLHEAEVRLLLTIIENEVACLNGERYTRHPHRGPRRWGHVKGSVVLYGQKASVSRAPTNAAMATLRTGGLEKSSVIADLDLTCRVK
jgi:hypothetical protein